MRTHRIAALLLAATLALSACSDDGPDPGESMSTWTPSGTPEEPSPTATPSAEPTEPKLPDAATKATEAGARAFITYYWDLINYAQVTGDVKALRRVSGPSCDGCRGGMNAIAEIYQSGGRAVGGEYATSVRRLSEARFENSDAYAFEGRAHVRNAEQTIFDGDGTTRTLTPTDNTVDVYVLWVNQRWRMDVLVVQ